MNSKSQIEFYLNKDWSLFLSSEIRQPYFKSLKAFLNKEIKQVKSDIETLSEEADQVTKIKLTEVKNLIKPLCKKSSVHEDNIINLLNYYSLVNELKSVQK